MDFTKHNLLGGQVCKQTPWFYTEKWQFCQNLNITGQLFSVKQQPKE